MTQRDRPASTLKIVGLIAAGLPAGVVAAMILSLMAMILLLEHRAFYHVLAVFMAFAGLFWCYRVVRSRHERESSEFFKCGLVIGFVFRNAALYWLAWDVSAGTSRSFLALGDSWHGQIVKVALFPEAVSEFEVMFRRDVSAVRKGNLLYDPFTGEMLKERDGVRYSVGPDRIDNELTVLYDPTNGTISGGDVPVRRHPSGDSPQISNPQAAN